MSAVGNYGVVSATKTLTIVSTLEERTVTVTAPEGKVILGVVSSDPYQTATLNEDGTECSMVFNRPGVNGQEWIRTVYATVAEMGC